MRDINLSPCRWHMRIWDVENNEWLCENDNDTLPYYGFDIRGGEVAAIQGMDAVYKNILHKEFIWEQSTGLKDKNGKEIYEGDIVRAIGEITLNDDIADNPIAEVMWVDSAAAFGEKYIIKDVPMIPFGLYAYEIIGNIHETPELIGGEE